MAELSGHPSVTGGGGAVSLHVISPPHGRVARLPTLHLQVPQSTKAKAISKDLGPKVTYCITSVTRDWLKRVSGELRFSVEGGSVRTLEGTAHRKPSWRPANALYDAHSFKKAFPVPVIHREQAPPIAVVTSVGHFHKP